LGLLLIFCGINLSAALTWFAVLAPMILGRTGGDSLALATVQSAMGIGGVIGGIAMSIWGGPKRRIHGVLLLGGISFLSSDFLLGVGRVTPVWAFAAFAGSVYIPFIVGCDLAIWQAKVPPAVQGRVFSVQTLLQQFTMPLGYLLAGPLADRILEPAMAPGGSLAPIFGGLVGTGPGAGMGLMFVGTFILGMTFCFGGYLFPAVRNVERDLPDHDQDIEDERRSAGVMTPETA
jgi:hypothetical protein